MIETLTIITICMLLLIFFRPGKTPPLENPLVIERPGKYHVTLAPQLNLAQPFVEAVAQRLLETRQHNGNSSTQIFEVRDKQAVSHGHDEYLLAITQREGMLYFQAAAPTADDKLKAIGELSSAVLSRLPDTGDLNRDVDGEIDNAAREVAATRRVEISPCS
jgi:regulator of protease activity HflC (stomatin/prohibitin superfamily)